MIMSVERKKRIQISVMFLTFLRKVESVSLFIILNKNMLTNRSITTMLSRLKASDDMSATVRRRLLEGVMM